jgi:hypothetical protein
MPVVLPPAVQQQQNIVTATELGADVSGAA